MSLRYNHRRGRTATTYYCQRQATEYGGALCQQIPGGCVDQAVGRLVVEALTHEAVEVALAVYEELGRQHEELAAIHRSRIERARHEADMAERQFLLVNPENRLVADNLEKRWNDALRVVTEAEEAFARWSRQHPAPLDAADEPAGSRPGGRTSPRSGTTRGRRHASGSRCCGCWSRTSPCCGGSRSRSTSAGKGGATSELRVPVPLNAFEARRTDPGVLKSIEAWAGTQTDEEIAARLNAEGKRTGSGLPFTHETVQRLRNERGIAGLREHLRRAGLRTTEEITRATGIAESTLRQWRKAGYLRAVRVDHKHWLYEVPTPKVLKRIAEARRPEVTVRPDTRHPTYEV